MIQIQIFCDVCKSNVSIVLAARKAHEVMATAVKLLDELHDPTCKEDPRGQGQAEPGGAAEADAPGEPAKGTSGRPH